MSAPLASTDGTIAIELPSWVGDCIMATPLLRAVRQALPQRRIVGIMRPGLDALLAGSPWFDEFHAVDPRGLRGVLRIAAVYRRECAAAALLLPNSFRSAFAARLGRAPVRIGYARDGRRRLLTHPLAWDRSERPIAQIEYYNRLARHALGDIEIDPRPELFVTDREAEDASRLVDNLRGFILLNPGANKPAKRWPAERFIDAARRLSREEDFGVVINGSPAERELASTIATSLPGSINLAERGVTLASIKGVIARAAVVITNDTGPRHIAAALGVPAVTLFGPTDHRWTTLNLPHERLLLAEPFLPADSVADDHQRECEVDRISVDDVVFAARSLLRSASAQRGTIIRAHRAAGT